jgi:hypothetical protein
MCDRWSAATRDQRTRRNLALARFRASTNSASELMVAVDLFTGDDGSVLEGDIDRLGPLE